MFFSSPPPSLLSSPIAPSLPVINCYADEAQLSAAAGASRKSLTTWPDSRGRTGGVRVRCMTSCAAVAGGKPPTAAGVKNMQNPEVPTNNPASTWQVSSTLLLFTVLLGGRISPQNDN